VPLADLLSAESKGKWWLVGAAWAGNPLVDNQTTQQAATVGGGLTKKQLEPEDDLITLARKQGMNTDIRRKVFMAVMGSSVRREQSGDNGS
jgi:nucleolar MIF4G domain-containing protein 1